MEECHTTQIVSSKVSGCLVENPECDYARNFGFSFVCSHPDPAGFNKSETGAPTKDEALERYDMLRRKRRDEFTNNLDETYRKFFSIQTDFFGEPLASVDLPMTMGTPISTGR